MDALLLIDRIDLQPDSTRSNIFIQSKPSGFKLLEDPVKDGPKVHGEMAIPAGIYPLGFYDSPKFAHQFYTMDDINIIEKKEWEKLPKIKRDLYHKHKVIWVKNVPNYQYILLHWGNTSADTEGCGLVGSSFGKLGNNSAVLASKQAYIKFYAKVAPLVAKGNQFIEYRNSFVMAA